MIRLVLLALVILAGGTVLRHYGRRAAATAAPRYRTLTPEEAKARLDSGDPVILLDVRTPEEFGAGHIPGAVGLPNEDIGPDMPVAFDRDAEVLLYCRTGRRSAEAAEKLAALGYENVGDLGGILSWPYETTVD